MAPCCQAAHPVRRHTESSDAARGHRDMHRRQTAITLDRRVGHGLSAWRATAALCAVLLIAALAACDVGVVGAVPAEEAPAPIGFPECEAEAYDFAGRGTLRQLGLDKATPVAPPEPDRVAMIWVTHDLKPRDFGPPGGAVEMVRMLCFEFPDGSGGSEWPVDHDWRPPSAQAPTKDASGSGIPVAVVVAGIAIAALLAVSLLAFGGLDRRPGGGGSGR